jgi:hypothetical protein
MVDSKKKVRKGSGKVAFMAHLEGIKKMLDAGHPMISVFEEYEKKLSIKSGQFGKYVRKHIRNENGDTNRAIEEKGKNAARKETRPVRPRTSDQPAFVSSPTPRDDLIHPKPKG